MNDLTQNQQKVADELVNLALQAAYIKIAPVLTDEDMAKIEELNSQDQTGNSVRYFLLSKVPNFDKIFQEEMDLLKSQININPK
ncbi:hypothetical protein HYS92_01175 [Candidatus Daviesbacteria bacterium]|nr:hypothetical protein [Candidatus Daviesbacteria bacterium]